jgi:hypothetical protein
MMNMPNLLRKLQHLLKSEILVIAGAPACQKELEEKGITNFISMKSNILDGVEGVIKLNSEFNRDKLMNFRVGDLVAIDLGHKNSKTPNNTKIEKIKR